MNFSLDKSIEILERTPRILVSYLDSLSLDWTHKNEGPNTWSPFDIVGHLIIGEKTDWIIRIQIILGTSQDKSFAPFNRFAQLNTNQDKDLKELLKEFSILRLKSIQTLKSLNIIDSDLSKTGIHPEFGEVTLGQLISTWAVHDLGHIAQISRVMASQYKAEVGPWSAYLGILKK